MLILNNNTVDFNIPIKDGFITDNYHILQAFPTIEYAFKPKAHSVILMSHLGRPNSQIDSKYSLAPVAADLQTLLPNRRVRFLNDCVGTLTEQVCQSCEEGGLDCGHESCKLFYDEIINCKTILWNGPPGVFEYEENFSNGYKVNASSYCGSD